MNEFKLYKSPKKAIKLALLCLPFIVMGIFIVSKGGGWIGWLSISFFGLGIPIALIQLFDRRPQIIINDIGVFDRTIHKEFINWEVIRGAYPISINGQPFICLVIDENFKPSKKKGHFYKSVVRMNEALGAQELNLNLGMINVDENKLAMFIVAMIHADKTNKSLLLKELPGLKK